MLMLGLGMSGQRYLLDELFDRQDVLICRTIIKAHDGRLWATRNPQGGATFHLELPLLVEESPAQREESVVEEAEPAIPPTKNSDTF